MPKLDHEKTTGISGAKKTVTLTATEGAYLALTAALVVSVIVDICSAGASTFLPMLAYGQIAAVIVAALGFFVLRTTRLHDARPGTARSIERKRP